MAPRLYKLAECAAGGEDVIMLIFGRGEMPKARKRTEEAEGDACGGEEADGETFGRTEKIEDETCVRTEKADGEAPVQTETAEGEICGQTEKAEDETACKPTEADGYCESVQENRDGTWLAVFRSTRGTAASIWGNTKKSYKEAFSAKNDVDTQQPTTASNEKARQHWGETATLWLRPPKKGHQFHNGMLSPIPNMHEDVMSDFRVPAANIDKIVVSRKYGSPNFSLNRHVLARMSRESGFPFKASAVEQTIDSFEFGEFEAFVLDNDMTTSIFAHNTFSFFPLSRHTRSLTPLAAPMGAYQAMSKAYASGEAESSVSAESARSLDFFMTGDMKKNGFFL